VDTRTKIATGPECAPRLAELRRNRGEVRVISGYFDPMLAEHAARLEAAGDGASAVAVVVLDPPDPILPARARTELVAALACVSLVLAPENCDAPAVDVPLEREDLQARAVFEAYVRERQS
jgi:hypothetical protein